MFHTSPRPPWPACSLFVALTHPLSRSIKHYIGPGYTSVTPTTKAKRELSHQAYLSFIQQKALKHPLSRNIKHYIGPGYRSMTPTTEGKRELFHPSIPLIHPT